MPNNYAYDASGNMTQDLGSGIGEIRYNLSNLPTALIKSNQLFQYKYDGSGKRIEKVQPNGSFESYRRGANGELLAIYDNLGALKQFELEGIGEMRVQGGQWRAAYYDKDLFGNIRSTIAQNGTTERTYDADLWGFEYDEKFGQPAKTYDEKFLGNPRDRESGFDFTGSRLYSSKLGMFLGVEPMYDELHSISPFSYGNNNPAKFGDKDGNNPIPFVAAGVGAGVYIAGAAVAALAVHSVSYATNAEYRKAVNAGSASAAGAVSKAVDNAVSNIKELANQVWSAQQEGAAEQADKHRFVVEPDGTTVDTKTTPKGSYNQPDGSRTDILQEKPHHNKETGENVGQSHT